MKTVSSYFTRCELDMIIASLDLYSRELMSKEYNPGQNVFDFADKIDDLHDRMCNISHLEEIKLSIDDLNILSCSTYRFFERGKVSPVDHIIFVRLQRSLFLDQAEYFDSPWMKF